MLMFRTVDTRCHFGGREGRTQNRLLLEDMLELVSEGRPFAADLLHGARRGHLPRSLEPLIDTSVHVSEHDASRAAARDLTSPNDGSRLSL